MRATLARGEHPDGVVEHMSHVQHPRDVGRRNDNGVGLTSIGFGMEQLVLHPVLVPFVFYLSGVVFACNIHMNSGISQDF